MTECLGPWARSFDVSCFGFILDSTSSTFFTFADGRGDAQSNCLSVSKKGGGAAFLDGVYCPASDGEPPGSASKYSQQKEEPKQCVEISDCAFQPQERWLAPLLRKTRPRSKVGFAVSSGQIESGVLGCVPCAGQMAWPLLQFC